jgi:hypothetical protein
VREQPAPHSRLETSPRARASPLAATRRSIAEDARSRSRPASSGSCQQRRRTPDESAQSRWLPPHSAGARSCGPRSTLADKIRRSPSSLQRARSRQLRSHGRQLRSRRRNGSSPFLPAECVHRGATSTRAGQIFRSAAERSTNGLSRSRCANARFAGVAPAFSARRGASTDFEASASSGGAISSRVRPSFSDGTASFSDGTAREADRTTRSSRV